MQDKSTNNNLTGNKTHPERTEDPNRQPHTLNLPPFQQKLDQKALEAPEPENKQQNSTGFRAWWAGLTTTRKVVIGVGTPLLMTAMILTAVFLAYYFSDKMAYDNNRVKTYYIKRTNQVVTKRPFSLIRPKVVGPNQVIEGYVMSIKKGNQSSDAKPNGFIVLTDKESGITLKQINATNHIIEIDPKQLLKYFYKNHLVEAKRLLAEAELTQAQADTAYDIYSEASAKQLLDSVAVQTKMDSIDTRLILQKQYRALQTEQGYQLERSISSRFEKYSNNKRLLAKFLRRIFRAIVKPVVKLVGNVLHINKKQPTVVNNIYNYTIITSTVNNYNISAAPKSTVVAGNNNSLAVDNSKNTAVKKSVQINKYNLIAVERSATKRLLKEQSQPATSTLQVEQDIPSARALQAALRCTDSDGEKRCSALEWEDKDCPYPLVKDQNKSSYVQQYIYVMGPKEAIDLLQSKPVSQ